MSRSILLSRWFGALCLSLALLAGCQSSQNKKHGCKLAKKHSNEAGGQFLRINIGADPRTLDPAKARDLQSITLSKMLFEGLMRINSQEKVEMALAENIDISADQITYTFTLREAKWSNGDPVTAEDFLYAWRRVIDPSTPSDNAFQLYSIKNAQAIKSGQMSVDDFGVMVIDDKTIQVVLENPTPYFLELTSYPAFFPINAKLDAENPQWSSDIQNFVGNGPFLIKEWKNQDYLTVTKNPLYWDAEIVKLDGISMFMMKEETELTMFENQEIDWAGSPLSVLPIDALGKLGADHLLNTQPILGTYFLRINTENKILCSSKMRKALALSVNREDLVNYALSGSQMAAVGFVPAALKIQEESYFKEIAFHEVIKLFDGALEDLTLTRAKCPDFELIFASGERNQRIAQVLQEQWKKSLGINVVLVGLEPKVYFERLYRGDFQIAAGSWFADFNDPISFLDVFKSKEHGPNHTKWENDDYLFALEKSKVSLDAQDRMQLFAQCEKILLDAMPIIPLFHYNMLFVKNKQVENVFISNVGVPDFRWAHFENNIN